MFKTNSQKRPSSFLNNPEEVEANKKISLSSAEDLDVNKNLPQFSSLQVSDSISSSILPAEIDLSAVALGDHWLDANLEVDLSVGVDKPKDIESPAKPARTYKDNTTAVPSPAGTERECGNINIDEASIVALSDLVVKLVPLAKIEVETEIS